MASLQVWLMITAFVTVLGSLGYSDNILRPFLPFLQFQLMHSSPVQVETDAPVAPAAAAADKTWAMKNGGSLGLNRKQGLTALVRMAVEEIYVLLKAASEGGEEVRALLFFTIMSIIACAVAVNSTISDSILPIAPHPAATLFSA